jgi:DNA-binding MarR family transcriptional regulator
MSLVEKFWETVPPSWFQTRARIRGAAAEQFGLTVEQFQVLRRIRRGFDSVSAIAEESRLSRPAVSKTVDGLVNRGLVARQTDQQDRRHIRLSLSSEGERVLMGIYAETNTWLEAQFATLTDSQRADLLRGLEALGEVMNK